MRFLRALAAVIPLALATAPVALRAQVPVWSLREELRIGQGAFLDDLPEIISFVTGRDGHGYALSTAAELLIFHPRGRLLRRMPTIVPDAADREVDERARRLLEMAIAQIPPDAQGNAERALGRRRIRRSYDPMALGWVGDTLWLSRFGVTRLGLFNRNGDSIGTLPYAMDLGGPLANAPRALLPDRSLLWSITESPAERWPPEGVFPPPPGRYRMPVFPGAPSTSGTPGTQPVPGSPGPAATPEPPPAQRFLLRATLGGQVVQGMEMFTQSRRSTMVANPHGVTARIPIPFQDDPLFAVTPDGSEIVFVERYHAQRPGQASYMVARFDGRTGKRTARAYPYTPVPVTPATGDSIIRRLLGDPGSPVSRQFLEGFESPAAARGAILRALDVTKYHAPITDLVAGADRTVWLREHGTGAWLVLDRDGNAIGRVTLPPGTRLLHADRGSVWALLEDAPPGAPARTLVRHRVVKP